MSNVILPKVYEDKNFLIINNNRLVKDLGVYPTPEDLPSNAILGNNAFVTSTTSTWAFSDELGWYDTLISSMGDMLSSNNLSDLDNFSEARDNLGLGSASLLNEEDILPTSFAQDVLLIDNNLSDLVNTTEARDNLGLGSASLLNEEDILPTSFAQDVLLIDNNLSDLTNTSIARGVLGVGGFHGIESNGIVTHTRSGLGTGLSPYNYTITIGSGNNTYFYKGEKFSTIDEIVFDLRVSLGVGILPNKLYYVYFDDITGILKVNATGFNLKENIPVYMIYTNSLISDIAISKEFHNHTRNIDWHINAHLTIGVRYYNGLSINKPTSSFDDNLDLSTGIIYDEDIPITITNPTISRIWYQVSAGIYTFVDSSLPYAGSVLGTPQFLDTDTYLLANVGSSNYACYWVYATNDNTRPIYIIPTQASNSHNTLNIARSEPIPTIAGLVHELSPEWKLIYRFIYKGDGEFQEYADYRNSSSLPAGQISLPTASSISIIPFSNITATNVQSALEQIRALIV